MKPTRRTQPYRASGSRPPSATLDKMLAGRKTPSPGASRGARQPLMDAMRGVRGKPKLRIPYS